MKIDKLVINTFPPVKYDFFKKKKIFYYILLVKVTVCYEYHQ